MPDARTYSPGGTGVATPAEAVTPPPASDVDEGNLAGQIDALLSNMGDAAATLAADQQAASVDDALRAPTTVSAEAPAPATPGALSPGDVESLSAQIEALVGEVESTRQSPGADAAPAPSVAGVSSDTSAGGAEAVAGDVASEVATGSGSSPGDVPESHGVPSTQNAPEVGDGAGAQTGPTPEATTSADVTVDLSALDAHLAAAANGAVSDPAPVMPAPVATSIRAPRAAEEARAAASRASASVAAAASPAPATAGTGDTRVSGAPSGVVEPTVRPARRPIVPTLRRLLRSATTTARPAGRWVLNVSATTLERSPKVAQQTAGWIGLVTVFFACCMWAIVLFFRSTPAPEVYGVPSTVLEHGEPTPQPRPRPSAHAADEHAAADDGHGAKADDHAAADAHGGGGDAHGGGGGDAHGGGGGGHGGH